MWDICVRGARVLDPYRDVDRIMDVALASGTIVAMGTHLRGPARRDFPAAGHVLVPGLVDVHAHVGGDAVAPLSLPPDTAGVGRGVTLLGDAGTAGTARIAALQQRVSHAVTSVALFLNVHPQGIAVLPQDWSIPLDCTRLAEAVARYGTHLCGLKLLATAGFAAVHGLEGLKRIKVLAGRHSLPLMIHLGTDAVPLPEGWERFCAGLPDVLESGDILSHCYTARPGGLITPDRRFYPQLQRAVERGVLLDSAVALDHFSFERARQGIADGFLPACISTDITRNNARRAVFDLPTTLSRFLALGLSLPDVIACATDNGRRALGRRPVPLREGEEANLTLLQVHEGPCVFGEGDNTLGGEVSLTPYAVFLRDTVYLQGKPGGLLEYTPL